VLLPEDFAIQPFEDSTGLLEDPVTLRARAADQGFLFFESLLPASLVDPFRQLARGAFETNGWVRQEAGNPPSMKAVPGAALEGRGWDDPRWLDFQYRLSVHTDFLTLAEDRKIMDVLEILLGEPAWLAAVNFCWLKLPGSPEQTTLPHQDQWYLPDCPRMWTVWVPLVDTPFDVGPLGCVPGSRHQGLWDHAGQFQGIRVSSDVRWASSEVHAGDVVFFDALTVHCAWSNVSASHARVSADIRYEPRSVGDASILRPPGPRMYFRDSRGIVDGAQDPRPER
jgi:ectoine hydroxylase-related dioxygenase (phytanoyl-CoA dioxygenase family)